MPTQDNKLSLEMQDAFMKMTSEEKIAFVLRDVGKDSELPDECQDVIWPDDSECCFPTNSCKMCSLPSNMNSRCNCSTVEGLHHYTCPLFDGSEFQMYEQQLKEMKQRKKDRLIEKLEFHEDFGAWLRKEGYSPEYVKMKCEDLAEIVFNELKL